MDRPASSPSSSSSSEDFRLVEIKGNSLEEMQLKLGKRLRVKKTLRFVVMSDTHNLHKAEHVPQGDVFIHAGDFTFRGNPAHVFRFNNFLGQLPHKHKIVVPGNHEFLPGVFAPVLRNCRFLRDEMIEVEGVRIYGSRFGSRFSPPFGLDRFAKKDWSALPEEADILIAHQPPKGIHDVTWSGRSRGNEALRKVVDHGRFCVVICGHNHEGYGVSYLNDLGGGDNFISTLFHNNDSSSNSNSNNNESDDAAAAAAQKNKPFHTINYHNNNNNTSSATATATSTIKEVGRRSYSYSYNTTFICAANQKGKSPILRKPMVFDYNIYEPMEEAQEQDGGDQ